MTSPCDSHGQLCPVCHTHLHCHSYYQEDGEGFWSLCCHQCGRYFSYDSDSERLEQYAHVPPAFGPRGWRKAVFYVGTFILTVVSWVTIPTIAAVLWLGKKFMKVRGK